MRDNKLSRKVIVQSLILSFAVVFLSVSAFAQGSSTGRITGAITDQTGGTLAGAMVTVTDTQRGTNRVLTTNEAGEYNAPELIPGTYAVKAEFRGFKTTERQNLGVEVGKEYRVDLSLQAGDQTQTITVTEELPLVETTSAALGGTISNQLIADLPVQGRNFTKLLELRPGVYLAPGSGKWSQSSNGMRREHNVYILNGIDTIEGFSSQSVVNATGVWGDATSLLPIDAIQEFNTQEVPKAEYGWKPGAIVNVGLKSGTNALHGTAYAFGRTDALDAKNPFITPDQPKQRTNIKDFGATASGPIIKDKLFFLLGYEGQRNSIGSPSASLTLPTRAHLSNTNLSILDACNTLTGAVTNGILQVPHDLSLKMAGLVYNGAGNCAVDPNNSGVFVDRTSFPYSADPVGHAQPDSGLAKIDYHIGDKHTITGEYFVGNFDSIAPQNNGAAQDYFDTFTHAKSMVTGLHWTWLPSSTVVNEARGGFNRYNQLSYPADCTTGVGHPDYSYLANFNSNTLPMSGAGLPANCGFPNISISGGFSGLGCCSTFPKIQGPDITIQFMDNVSYIHGRHSFKFGEENRHLSYTGGTYGGSKGSFSFGSLTDFLLGTFNSTPSLLVGQPERHLTEWGFAAFAQDDWRITNRLVVNMGLRWETVTPIKASGNLLANFDPTSPTGLVQANGGLWKRTNDFSPRLGFAWDIKGDSSWVLRSGASIIYVIEGYNAFVSQQNVAGISVLGLNFNPTGALLNGVAGPGNITTGQVVFPSGNAATTAGVPNWAIAGVFPAGTATATPRCDSPLATVNGSAGKPCSILAVDPNFRRPYATAWNLSLQHAFNSNLSLQVAYVGSHGTKLMGMTDINAPSYGAGWLTKVGNGCIVPAATAMATNVNAASSTTPAVNTTCENLSRPFFTKYPHLSNIIQISNLDVSNYNALQATLTMRPWHGFSNLIGYTFGHSLADGNGDWNGSNVPEDPFNVRGDYGPSENDVRHRLTMSMSYAFPDKKGYAQMLEGWKLNSVVNLQTGLPWSVSDTTNDTSGLGLKTDRWNFYGDPNTFTNNVPNAIPYFPGTGSNNTISTDAACVSKAAALDSSFTPLNPGWTYTNALSKFGCYDLGGNLLLPPAFGTIGTAPVGLFRGIGIKLWDASVSKDVHFTERLNGTFRFEVFNILNHRNYTPSIQNTMSAGVASSTKLASLPAGNINFGASRATPDVQVSNPSVGSGAPRGVQLGLKLSF